MDPLPKRGGNVPLLKNFKKRKGSQVFISCNFFWIKREANMTAQTLAKFCSPQDLPVNYFPKNLPTPLGEAWFRDFCCSSFSVWMKYFHLAKKKNLQLAHGPSNKPDIEFWEEKNYSSNITKWTQMFRPLWEWCVLSHVIVNYISKITGFTIDVGREVISPLKGVFE